MRNLFWFTVLVLFLSGCSASNKTIDIIHIANNDEETANLKQKLENAEHVEKGAAVFVKDQLLIGVEVNPLSRWNKEKIEKDLQDEMDKAFPSYKVLVSSDMKILWETEKLQDESISPEKMEEEVKKIKALEKEET